MHVKESQLSNEIRNELIKISEGEFTNPINIVNNFIILKINEKNLISEKFDEDRIVKEIMILERKRQYENYSRIYFNKIKLNSQIDEL